MVRKRTIFFVIAALILIPILLGLTPIKFVQKLGGYCPFSQNKLAPSCGPCIYNSVTLQSETISLVLAALPSTPFAVQSSPILSGEMVTPDETIISSPLTESPPLRC